MQSTPKKPPVGDKGLFEALLKLAVPRKEAKAAD